MPQARMTRSDIISAVREITEMDSADVSDTVINIYLRDGYNRIIELERRWKFLETSFTLTSTVGMNEYTVDNFTADEIREVVAVVDSDDNRLEYVGYDEMEEAISRSSFDSLTSGTPTFYTFWHDKMILFPTPQVATAYTVRAYRYPTDWVTDDVEPDGVASFDMALVYYAISRIYQAQEELNTAATYERMYNDTIVLARRDLTRPPSSAPMVFAGNTSFRAFKGKGWSGW